MLLCFDGSDDAAAAIAEAGELLGPRAAVVLAVCEPVAVWAPSDPATILSAPLSKLASNALGLDEIASEYHDRIKVAKINIDENPQTPPKFGIRGIPTLILFKNGTVEAQKVGAVSKSQLSAFLDSNL